MSRSKMPKWQCASDANNYFSTHQRVKSYDIQIAKGATTLSWNCDGTRLVCGSEDRKIAVATVDSSCRVRVERSFNAHDGAVFNVAFQNSGPYVFASASNDKSVCIWDVRQSKNHTRLNTSAQNVYVSWSPCGRYLAYADKNDKIHIVDGVNLSIIKTVECKIYQVHEFVYHPSGQYIFVCGGSGQVAVYSVPDMELIHTIQANSQLSICVSLAISKDGSRLAIGANDALCSIWSVDDLICEATVARMDYPIRSCSFSSDGLLLATGSEDRVIDVAWTSDGSKVTADTSVEGEVFAVAWHPKQPILAYTYASTSSRDRDSIRLFGFSG